MASGNHEVPGEVQLSGLRDLFERLRDRPPWWRRERLRPVLFLLAPARSTGPVVETFDKCCADEHAPISRIAANTGAQDVTDVLREVKRGLSRRRCRPRGEPALRFPLLEMALWLRSLREVYLLNLARAEEQRGKGADGHIVAEENPVPEEQDNQRLMGDLANIYRWDTTLRDRLTQMIRRRGRNLLRDPDGAERGRSAALLAYVGQVAPVGVALVAFVSAALASTLDLVAAGVAAAVGLLLVTGQILARARGWFAVRRYGWFCRQPYMRWGPANDFLGIALDLIIPSRTDGREQREQLDRLLVAAFLEDLRRSYRRDVRRAAWARVNYPVVIFDHLSPGHAGCRFIEIVEEVRARAQVKRGLSDFDPLVIVAGIDPDSPASVDDSADAEGSALVDHLARSIAVERADDTPAGMDEVAGLWERRLREQRRIDALGFRRELRVDLTKGDDVGPDRIKPARRRPWATHPVLPWVAMVAVLFASAVFVSPIVAGCGPPAVQRATGGECVGITDGSYRFNPRLGGVERRIKELNDQVAATRRPYVTIVYLGPLTADPVTKNPRQDLLAAAQGELVGMAVAQQRLNDAGSPLRMRILLANAGSKMRYARKVAEQVRAVTLRDPHIVGVVGFEQSRVQTQQAIAEISKAALPMIGTASSFDGTGRQAIGFSPYFFRLAPLNRRVAAHAAYWARNGLLGIRARTATVFSDGDPADLYSQNLAADFRSEFGPDKVTMLSYTDPSQVPAMVQRACARPSDLFYYVGRSDEFRGFLNQLTNIACGGRRVVLADDEIATYVNDNAREIGGDDAIRLYYTPLALREAWTPRWVGNQPVGRFFNDYDTVVRQIVGSNAPPDARPSLTRAAVSYDATLMFADVTSQIFGDRHVQPTPAAVLEALIEPQPGPRLQGASGVLSFGSLAAGHQVEDKPVLLANVRPTGALDVLAVCGRLVASGQSPADCPAQGGRQASP